MIEEARDKPRRIQWQELMDDVCGQPLLGEPRRRYGSGRHQHVEVLGMNPLNQWNDGNEFPNTRAMYPHQRTGRARNTALTAPLADPRAVLLAALEAIRQQHIGKR